jgi:hypothetical protein
MDLGHERFDKIRALASDHCCSESGHRDFDTRWAGLMAVGGGAEIADNG